MIGKIISYTETGSSFLAIIKIKGGKNIPAKIDKQYRWVIKMGTIGKVVLGEVNFFLPSVKIKPAKIKKRVALVTGSSRGIGLAIATELSRKGFIVITNGKSGPTKGNFYRCDISDYNQVEIMIRKIIDRHKSLDVLVNNAGILRDKKLINMSLEMWDEVIATNLTGTFNCTKAVIPIMQKQHGGYIVNISSYVAKSGHIGQANYTASKGGIIAFTKTVAREYAADGILVNAVAPGLIMTEMAESIPAADRQQIINEIPLGRLGKPEEIAKTVSFLVSGEANYITGQTIDVNGGLYM